LRPTRTSDYGDRHCWGPMTHSGTRLCRLRRPTLLLLLGRNRAGSRRRHASGSTTSHSAPHGPLCHWSSPVPLHVRPHRGHTPAAAEEMCVAASNARTAATDAIVEREIGGCRVRSECVQPREGTGSVRNALWCYIEPMRVLRVRSTKVERRLAQYVYARWCVCTYVRTRRAGYGTYVRTAVVRSSRFGVLRKARVGWMRIRAG
jgi:hypothetical protein